MARWWRRRSWTQQPGVDVFDASAPPSFEPPVVDDVAPESMTAAALAVNSLVGGRRALVPQYESWQRELWDYYDTMGDFGYAVTWRSNMVSRVRLRAGRLEPGNDEPTIVDEGRAAELVAELSSELNSTADVMATLSTHLDIPGEGWLIGEEFNGRNRWQVRSNDEIRRRGDTFQVISETSSLGEIDWRDLASNHYIVRIWRPHKRYRHLAYSPAKAARGAMRELELANRHIQAQYLSRLASAGVIIFPDEITFPVREEFADAPDPFMAEWIENARAAISEPGTASGVVPMPIRVPGEYVDKIKNLDFTLKIDEKVIEKRESAIKRLATQLNIPQEVLLGMGGLNHWNAWAADETSLKVNIAPDAELICQALTAGYLQPRLKASGVEDWANWVVWYDMSELTLRPDHSDDAVLLYDRMEINGAALRRETGFSEADKPTNEELKEQALKIIIKTLPSGAGSALSQITGEHVEITPVAAAPPGEIPAPEAEPEPAPEDRSPPDPDTAREAATAARTERMRQQSQALHAVRFATGRPPDLLHPALCAQHAYSCPFTHAAVKLDALPRPGMSGTYEARINPFGQLVIGQRSPYLDTSLFLTTASPRSSNGYAHSRR